jgi:hypothetical protein
MNVPLYLSQYRGASVPIHFSRLTSIESVEVRIAAKSIGATADNECLKPSSDIAGRTAPTFGPSLKNAGRSNKGSAA